MQKVRHSLTPWHRTQLGRGVAAPSPLSLEVSKSLISYYVYKMPLPEQSWGGEKEVTPLGVSGRIWKVWLTCVNLPESHPEEQCPWLGMGRG